MPSPEQLADAGAFTVLVALGISLGVAFVRGWIVPRFVYDREVARGDRLETQVDRMAEALEALADERDADRRQAAGRASG